MLTLEQLLMLVEYDKTVVLVQYGTDEQICIFTQSEELEYKREYEKVEPHLGRLDELLDEEYNTLDELLDLKLERDRYKEAHKEVRQKYIDKDVELQIVDRIVLQYEKRINELEEQLNEYEPKIR